MQIDCTSHDLATTMFFGGHRLTRDHRFVDRRVTINDHTIHWNRRARLDSQLILFVNQF